MKITDMKSKSVNLMIDPPDWDILISIWQWHTSLKRTPSEDIIVDNTESLKQWSYFI